MPEANPDESFAAAVLDVVDSIPPGCVLSYGDVAALLGSRGARAVGSILRVSGGDHPWWRVVRSGGLPPRGLEDRARVHYEREGTPVAPLNAEPGYRVQYAVARWDPVPLAGGTDCSTTTDPENACHDGSPPSH